MKEINRVMGWRAGGPAGRGGGLGKASSRRLRPEPVLSPEDRQEAATPRQEAEQTHSAEATGQPRVWLVC